MDKGLKLIEELKQQLENLQLQKKDNQDKIQFCEQKKANLNKRIEILENQLKRNLEEKNDILVAPKLYKKEKKKLLKTIVSAIIVALLFMSAVGGICAIFEGIEILLTILKMSVTALPLLGGAMFYMFNSLLKNQYKTGDISELEELISEIEEEIEENKEKQNELNNTLRHLRKIELELTHQISKLTSEKEKIELIRTKIINDYCNNHEFDNLFDKALSDTEKNNNRNVKKATIS